MINIDIRKMTEQLLAPFLRKPNRISWLNSLLSPIKSMWDSYVKWRADKLYEAHVTPQVISIEAYLNRLFDPLSRAIEVERGESKDRFLSLWSEQNGPYFSADADDFFLFLDGEYGDKVLDKFTVLVPKDIDQTRVAGVLDKIKAVGTTYEIKIKGSKA